MDRDMNRKERMMWTRDILLYTGACRKWVERFDRDYPGGVLITRENIDLLSGRGYPIWLVGIDLRDRDLDFRGADLRRANFMGADLSDSRFDDANLQQANFQGAWLCDTWFLGADLQNAVFNGAHLGGAKFRGADLREAILTNACLDGAEFDGANLQSACLRGCVTRNAYMGGWIVDNKGFATREGV